MQTTKHDRIDFRLLVDWDEESKIYIGTCPGFFYGGVHGNDSKEVFKELLEVVGEWIAILEEDGKTIPISKDIAAEGV